MEEEYDDPCRLLVLLGPLATYADTSRSCLPEAKGPRLRSHFLSDLAEVCSRELFYIVGLHLLNLHMLPWRHRRIKMRISLTQSVSGRAHTAPTLFGDWDHVVLVQVYVHAGWSLLRGR